MIVLLPWLFGSADTFNSNNVTTFLAKRREGFSLGLIYELVPSTGVTFTTKLDFKTNYSSIYCRTGVILRQSALDCFDCLFQDYLLYTYVQYMLEEFLLNCSFVLKVLLRIGSYCSLPQ